MKQKIKNILKSFFGMKIHLGTVILACVIFAGIGWGVCSYKQVQLFGGQENFTLAQKYLEIKKLIDDHYVGTSDDEALSDASSAAMIKSLGDKWSYYMNPDEYEAYKLYSANEYTGIGVSIQDDAESGGFLIISVTADSPAEASGIQVGEIILAVDGQSVKGMEISEVRSLIRTHIDESVTITIKNDNETRDVDIDCTVIYTKPVSYELLDHNVGYIQIVNFELGAGDSAIAAVEDLLAQGATSLVFDVRSNPGGQLSQLLKILDYLLPEGDMFISVNEAGEETVTQSDNICIDVPMAVLVNSDSYSAAEFFAAALSDFNWATVVGEQTTGKGRSQQTLELSDGSAVHISTNKYLTPSGVDLSEQGGITPDIIVALTETGDAQLDSAISAVLSE